MGNAQSTADGRKIAKPKTVGIARSTKSTSPSSQIDDTNTSPKAMESGSSESPNLPVSSTSGTTTEEEFRQQAPLQLHSPEGHSVQQQRDSQVDLLAANVVRSLSRSGSRANTVSARSSLAQLQNGSQLSVATDKTIDIHSAIAIIHELRKTASPEDMAALYQALLPVASRDSLSLTTTGDSQEDMDPSTAALIRRKSFAQPGIATRYAKPDTTVHRKSLPTPSPRPSQWKKEVMGASQLARLSSPAGLEPPPEILESRAQTPSNLEYSQLGNLKHGSLMVINGCPSPVPSCASPRSISRKPSGDCEEDFFTASERASACNDDESRYSSHHVPDNAREGDDRTEDNHDTRSREQANAMEKYAKRRDGSPLKQELRLERQGSQDADAESIYSRHLRPTRSVASLHSSQPRGRFSFEEGRFNEERQPVQKPAPGPTQSAISLASEYMSEMPPSPYMGDSTQQYEALDVPRDEGYDDSPSSDAREQVVELPAGISQGAGQISPRKPLRSHPTSETVPTLTSIKPKRPVGVKTDSGYSSSASASLVDSMSPVEMHQPNLSTVESLAGVPAAQRFSSSKDAIDIAVRIGPIGSRGTPDSVAGAESDIIESIEKDPAKEEKLKRTKSWRKSVRKSLPRLLASESTAFGTSKSTSASASSSTEYKPKKLQKRRPLSQPPINVADRHVLDRTIPRIPSTVFSRYSGRLSVSSGMQHLDQTYDNEIDRRDSSATTAASKSALPSCFFPDSEEAPPPPAHRLGFARRSFRRSRTQVDEQEVLITGVADFGTASQSLGTSPFDVAVSAPRRPMSAYATQPHHVSTNTPRTGLHEGWDDETASRFAQMRSRERAAQQSSWGERNNERRPMPPRPVSYHEDMPSGANRTSNAPMRRPKSMHAHKVPSVSDQLNQMLDRDPLRGLPPLYPKAPQKSSNREREPSPVKKLVNVFEQRASQESAPPPMPLPQPDWSDSSRIWRERRLNAQTNVVTTSSQKGHNMTTTTTTVTAFDAAARPAIQNRKSMPQMRHSPQQATAFGDEGMFGRYGGGNRHYADTQRFAPGLKREIAPTSSAAKQIYGIDFGDVPLRVI